jgi:chromate transporter
VIAAAALIGWIGGRVSPQVFTMAGHAAAKSTGVKAILDDDTPSPPHARFSVGRVAKVTAVFVAIWAACLGALAFAFGAASDLAQMGWFFTKSAMVTFGGAYAVLPYVLQGAVENYGWATASQMIDGLALGESTPGPLIMVVAYVGFLGGWHHAALGPDSLLAGGVAGACVATFFTFLPSFMFILAGGPFVERTRDDLKLTAPLTAISAAVVGVIVNLTVYFAWHVLWPAATPGAPFSGGFDYSSAVIAAVAAVALLTKKVEVIPVIAVSGIAGLALWMAGI